MDGFVGSVDDHFVVALVSQPQIQESSTVNRCQFRAHITKRSHKLKHLKRRQAGVQADRGHGQRNVLTAHDLIRGEHTSCGYRCNWRRKAQSSIVRSLRTVFADCARNARRDVQRATVRRDTSVPACHLPCSQ